MVFYYNVIKKAKIVCLLVVEWLATACRQRLQQTCACWTTRPQDHPECRQLCGHSRQRRRGSSVVVTSGGNTRMRFNCVFAAGATTVGVYSSITAPLNAVSRFSRVTMTRLSGVFTKKWAKGQFFALQPEDRNQFQEVKTKQYFYMQNLHIYMCKRMCRRISTSVCIVMAMLRPTTTATTFTFLTCNSCFSYCFACTLISWNRSQCSNYTSQ